MIKIAWAPLYHHPLPENHRFPMEKYSLLPDQLVFEGTVSKDQFFIPTAVTENEILLCHSKLYWNKLSINIAGGTHHAFSERGEGFCLLNDVAIATSVLLEEKTIKRALIVDLDVHQGNGTAEIFRTNPDIFTFSMHGKKNYPLHKEVSDLDIELEDGTSDDQYLSILFDQLPKLIDKHKPDILFYQSGVDVLQTDKLGRLALTIQVCR